MGGQFKGFKYFYFLFIFGKIITGLDFGMGIFLCLIKCFLR